MFRPFDVFSIDNKGPLWVASAETVPQALEIVRGKGHGSYFVISHQTGEKTLYSAEPNGQIKQVPTREHAGVTPVTSPDPLAALSSPQL